MPQDIEKSLLGLNLHELSELMGERGEPSYRANQIFQSLYKQRVDNLDAISTLPQVLRADLMRQYSIGQPKVEQKFLSADGTVRYLMQLADGETIETVWMPEGDGGEAGDGSEAAMESEGLEHSWSRGTICVSSQVGCAVDCTFCLTALLKVRRNLTPGEIVGQVCSVLNDQGANPPNDRVNLVFMGMGEPFLNYDNFMKAVRLLVDGVGIPELRMTVSTAGIVPRIYDFAQEPIRPKLAISLNASNDSLRTELMPINRKWDTEKLLAAAREFPLRNREKLTFEYVLLKGVNDSVDHARELVELVRGIRAKVNLIALNPGPEIGFEIPETDQVQQFKQILMNAGMPAFLRRPRGRDIYAACG
ncbi:MAG TPA: 23S rRNA (adenine(2503)-C(2))-methyltransferase RlmN, partial [Terriglobales bacterium]|nr:23S rRNA (adenine(2503)-C(2))-methyltransferase RlmN [Terriglobales bacterium]